MRVFRMALVATNMIWCHWPRNWLQDHRSLLFAGTVAIDGGFAFFHRLPDRSIDEADISERTPVLAEFIQDTMASHGLAKAPIAIGFSNGAIMAAALLLTRPRLLAGAILFRPLSPFRDDPPTRLDGCRS
jgi:phospholipase/carboxylesterase